MMGLKGAKYGECGKGEFSSFICGVLESKPHMLSEFMWFCLLLVGFGSFYDLPFDKDDFFKSFELRTKSRINNA